MRQKLRTYVDRFNREDEECYQQLIPNCQALDYLASQIPLLDCPDPQLEEIYYFRWWTLRKHWKNTEKGHILTEFLPPVRWAGPYNSIVCPVGFHIREGRWLADDDRWLEECIRFWLNGHGDLLKYSSWLAHSLWEYCSVKNDFSLAVSLLPQLIRYFHQREAIHLRKCGLYWSNDGRDGMEYSISGSGLRPTMNTYAWADALAISRIAALAGDSVQEARFARIADELRDTIDRLLWDGSFYKTIPLAQDQELSGSLRPPVPEAQDVRELIGFIPWYFSLPEPGREQGFSQLLRPDGFFAPAGLTTAEQRHRRYMEPFAHECLWNGPVWPFATSQVLVAMANVLRQGTQVVTREDYYRLLLQYANSHHRTLPDGRTVPWIDENLHPQTGQWLAREQLARDGWLPRKGGYERGKDYNHSLFCDLVLSGLLGIQVQNGQFTAQPLIPDAWDWFRVENLRLNGCSYSITYDKYGTHYKKGSGLIIQQEELPYVFS